MTNLVNAARFAELVNEPNAADSEYVNYFVLDIESFDPGQTAEIAEWTRRQPVPVIGISKDIWGISEYIDVRVETHDELQLVKDAIDQHPRTCAVLVQVTRVTSELPVNNALVVESLGYSTLQGGDEYRSWLANSKRDRSAADIDNPVVVTREGDALNIRLNTPDNRNALSVAMRDALTDAFKLVAMDNSILEVNVSGEGPCFSAGGDLTEFGDVEDQAEAHRIRQMRMPARYLAQEAHRYSFHLHGACIGAGIELPAFARYITATPDTWFQLPEVAMGLIPGAGGCVSIPGRIGRQRHNWLAITGERLGAQQAYDWGLVDRVID